MIPIITHTADFYSLAVDGADNDKEGYTQIPTMLGVQCNVQPVSSNPSELATGLFSKGHNMYLPVTYSGIREGYRCTVSGLYDGEINRTLIVKGVEDWSRGPLPHFQLELEEPLS